MKKWIMHSSLWCVFRCVLITTGLSLGASNLFAQKHYGHQTTIEALPAEGLQRFALNAQVLARLQSHHYADLRVVNGHGAVVPFALISSSAEPSTPASTTLPAMPIMGSPSTLSAGTGFNLRIETTNGQSKVYLHQDGMNNASATNDKAVQQVVGALFATQSLENPVTEIDLDVDLPIGTPIQFDAQVSPDLKMWQPLAAAVLYNFNEQQKSLRIAVAPQSVKGKFVRITWNEALQNNQKLKLREAKFYSQKEAPKTSTDTSNKIPIAIAPMKNAHEIHFRLPFATAFQSLTIALTQTNSLIPVRIFSKPEDTKKLTRRRPQEWIEVAQTVLYSMQNAGKTQSSPDILAPWGEAREFKIQADAKTAGFSTLPTITVNFELMQVVFLASGEPPYQLQYGLENQTSSSALSIETLIPAYQRGNENALPLAHLTTTENTAGNTSIAAADAKPLATDSRTYWLWGILLLAVGALSIMAWMLLREKNYESAPNQG